MVLKKSRIFARLLGIDSVVSWKIVVLIRFGEMGTMCVC